MTRAEERNTAWGLPPGEKLKKCRLCEEAQREDLANDDLRTLTQVRH